MTPEGIKPIADQIGAPDDPLVIPEWIEEALREDPDIWATFQSFPFFYQRLKVGWINEAGTSPSRLPEAQRRLAYLLKMTGKGKMYGTIPLP